MKNSLYLIVLCSLPLCQELNAQSNTSAKADALSGIYCGLKDPLTLDEGPSAALEASEIKVAAGIKDYFGMKDLSTASIALLFPIKKQHAAGIYYGRSGLNDFNTQKLQLTYAIHLSAKLNAGIQIERNVRQYTDDLNSNSSVLTGNVGISADLMKGFSAFASISNPGKTRWNNSARTPLPVKFLFGTRIKFGSKLNLFSQISREANSKTVLSNAFEYSPQATINIRTGYNSGSGSFAFGAGIQRQNTIIDFSCQVHPVLGITPGISLQQILK